MNTELKPIVTKQKSFYGKACVIVWDFKSYKEILLKSYDTIVSEIREESGIRDIKINGYYSETTKRHINDFINQYTHHIGVYRKKDIENGLRFSERI